MKTGAAPSSEVVRPTVGRDASNLLFGAKQTLLEMFRDKSILATVGAWFPGKGMSNSLEQVYLLQRVPSGFPLDFQPRSSIGSPAAT